MLQDMQLNPDDAYRRQTALPAHPFRPRRPAGRTDRTDGYERLSTDRSDCRLSYASPRGYHAAPRPYLQPVDIHRRQQRNLARFEKMAKNMQSLSRYSRSNQINKERLDEYLNVAHTNGPQSVRCHGKDHRMGGKRDELRRRRMTWAAHWRWWNVPPP